MIFHGIDDQTVELTIINYEFPANNDGSGDSNWLNICLKVKSKLGNWQIVHSSLMTTEVQELINWFYALSKNTQVTNKEISFTEPNLSFKVLNNAANKKTIRINFELECKPKFVEDAAECFVDCIVDNHKLERLASDLSAELKKFPERIACN